VAVEPTERDDAGKPRRGFRRNLVDLLYRLRTEADAPVEQAVAYGAGAFIGSLPVYGLHLPLCLLVGKLLGLNRLKMFLASNLNNPFIGPFLVTAEIQVGSLLRRGQLYQMTPAQLRQVRLVDCLGDLVVGSLAVGCVLGLVFAGLAYTALRHNAHDRFRRLLVETAARRFLAAGYWQWELVRARLRSDRVYVGLVRRGLLPARGQLLDVGCGRGPLLAVLATDRDQELAEPRPADWAPSPHQSLELVGLDSRPRVVAVARQALSEVAAIHETDLATAELPRCAGAVLLDVMAGRRPEEQDRLLARVVDALEPGGALILRERDASAGWRSVRKALVRRMASVFRGHPFRRFHDRPAAAWREALETYGLEVTEVAVGHPHRSGKVVLRARRTERFGGP
jgi:uncharacterized protein (DUF2062 family)/trans-aconitate methyltransferase